MIAPQVVVHRDPRFWPDPEKFDPLRFADDGKPSRPRFAYYPFGAGSRQCIGEGLAWMEGVFSLATIFRNWRVRPAPGAPKELLTSPMISLRPKEGVPLVLERR
jgi:cytochrome P450